MRQKQTDTGAEGGGSSPQRPHPQERFAGAEHGYDLKSIVARLRREVKRDGHQQETIYRFGATALAVFVFDAGAQLPEHGADGLVVVHLLDGAITVHTPDRSYSLAPGNVVTLTPGVRHSVEAHDQSAMLLTVVLEERSQAPGDGTAEGGNR